MIFKKLGIFVASMFFATVAFADVLEVQENHPTKYVVKKGDTLWDISSKFLKKPWYWPKIWHVNPQINDPHWIYPGDVLTLVWVDGKPYLQKAKSTKKSDPIPTISAEYIKTYLKNDVLLPYSSDELNALPFVYGNNDGRLLLAETKNLFVKGKLSKSKQYGVYHKGVLVKDDAGNKLGYRAELVGVIVAGEEYPDNLTKSFLVKNKNTVKIGDYVLPLNQDGGYDLYFTPRAATVDTSVVAIADDAAYAGRYSTVILGKGSKDGVRKGDVFSLSRPGVKVVGSKADDMNYELVTSMGKSLGASALPDEVIGQVMVYRTYDNASLALIMVTKEHVNVGFKAIKP
ncbi:MAG: LysM peptidoglycan-binding domain-containing protein [Succinivibrionaceae bacterium]